MSSDEFKNVIHKKFLQIIYIYKRYLILNNLESLIFYKTQPTNLMDFKLIFMQVS